MNSLRQSLNPYISFSDYVGFRIKENEVIHKKNGGWVPNIDIQLMLGGYTLDFKNNGLVEYMCAFMILENIIDNIEPNNRDDSLLGKYKKFKPRTEKEKLIKTVYRLFRIIRNAVMHERDAINHNDSNIAIAYKLEDRNDPSKSKDISLKMRNDVLDNLKYIVCQLSSFDTMNEYRWCEVISIYNEIIINNIEIKDETSSNGATDTLGMIMFDKPLMKDTSYRPQIKVDISESNDVLLIDRGYLADVIKNKKDEKYFIQEQGFIMTYSANYLITFKGKNYTIPDEWLEIDEVSESVGRLPLEYLQNYHKQ